MQAIGYHPLSVMTSSVNEDDAAKVQGNKFDDESFDPSTCASSSQSIKAPVKSCMLITPCMHRFYYDPRSDMGRRLLAASMMDESQRTKPDFHLAYGPKAWENLVRCQQFLGCIAPTMFIESLRLPLLNAINFLVHAVDIRTRGLFWRFCAAIKRGHYDRPGRIRTTETKTKLCVFSKDQVVNLHHHGITFSLFLGCLQRCGQRRLGSIVYPAPDQLKQGMQQLLAEARTKLSEDNPDVVAIAATTCQRLIALHPYEDSNGRTARALMYYMLMHYNFPPPILEHINEDIVLTQSAYVRAVQNGVLRSYNMLCKSTDVAARKSKAPEVKNEEKQKYVSALPALQ